MGSDAVALVLLFGGLFVYFIPSIVAHNREHQNAASITVINIFLGWTFLGWVVALAMGLSAVKTKEASIDKAA